MTLKWNWTEFIYHKLISPKILWAFLWRLMYQLPWRIYLSQFLLSLNQARNTNNSWLACSLWSMYQLKREKRSMLASRFITSQCICSLVVSSKSGSIWEPRNSLNLLKLSTNIKYNQASSTDYPELKCQCTLSHDWTGRSKSTRISKMLN